MQPDPTPPCVRVVLADDHDLVRTGMKALLSMVSGVKVIAEARDGQELIGLVDSLNTDLVMTDSSMPVLDGITAIRADPCQPSAGPAAGPLDRQHGGLRQARRGQRPRVGLLGPTLE